MTRADPSSVPSLPERIAGRRQQLTPRERRIADAMIEGYPHAGLEGATALGARLDISAATVVRFVAKLGYAGMPDLQRELRAAVERRLSGPLDRLERGLAEAGAPSAVVAAAFDAALRTIEGARARFDQATAEAIARRIATAPGRVLVLGEKKGRAVATYLYAQLALARPRVELLVTDAAFEGDRLLDLGGDDVVVAIDVRRYVARALVAARFAVERGAGLVVLADRHDAPLARIAGEVMTAPIEGVGAFDGYAGLIALADVLSALVVAQDPDAVRVRMAAGEAAWERLGIFG